MQNSGRLLVMQRARTLAVETYRLTATFPRDERFGLTAQMRRAVVSIGSNIAEGCGRATARELASFLHYALGSASELEFQFNIASDLRYATAEELAAATEQTVALKRMLARLIIAVRAQSKS